MIETYYIYFCFHECGLNLTKAAGCLFLFFQDIQIIVWRLFSEPKLVSFLQTKKKGKSPPHFCPLNRCWCNWHLTFCLHAETQIGGWIMTFAQQTEKNQPTMIRWDEQSSAAAPDTMCHFKMKISICLFSVKTKCHSTFCAPVFGSIWLLNWRLGDSSRAWGGVSRWRTAHSTTPHSNNRLIIEANSSNWNPGPTADATAIHLPPRTCAFLTILLWNRGLVSKRCSKFVIFRLLGKIFLLQKSFMHFADLRLKIQPFFPPFTEEMYSLVIDES